MSVSHSPETFELPQLTSLALFPNCFLRLESRLDHVAHSSSTHSPFLKCRYDSGHNIFGITVTRWNIQTSPNFCGDNDNKMCDKKIIMMTMMESESERYEPNYIPTRPNSRQVSARITVALSLCLKISAPSSSL